MTSSLVGSEMCIRDRPKTPWWSILRTVRTSRGGTVLYGSDLGAWLTCFLPVSYTHLTLPTICSV
eukprot:3336395-Prorocentrum_lima.AAC.1